ncbi:LCP family protein [Ruminococcus albus]|uniref:Cell envelope-related function transcriptional attenuator common domain-containing protein n=1 Tax=Ruminococcus albus TaxID=1264 RepID=A0A1H7NIM3_RUMAL|nr:LCP family protein [Ruminococcus albus]SEL23169.1 cell envelope-related function transcriptional attenuator common domain-containing protein [Ruminococcus albus]
MDRDEKFRRPADPYEEEYQRQLEEISRIAGDTGGEVDLSMGSADDVFASEYQRYGTPTQMGGQPYGEEYMNRQYAQARTGGGNRQPSRSSASRQRREDNGGGQYSRPQGNSQYGAESPRQNYPEDDMRERRTSRGGSNDGQRKRPARGAEGERTGANRSRERREERPAQRRDRSSGQPAKKKAERREKPHASEELRFGTRNGGKVPAHETRHPVRSFFRTLIILLLVIFIGLNALLYYYITLVNRRGRGDRSFTGGSMDSKSVTNILLIGSDTRSEKENGRTDSMILMSVNKDKKTITMTSFMRDMYVEIKGRRTGDDDIDVWDKLNSAYVYGGAELLMDTIEYNFDISVDDYVYVDFFAFIDIVDSIGGLEIDITDEEAAGLEDPLGEQNKYLKQPEDTDCLDHGGKLLLNGNQTLAYARLRYVGNADFQRTERQREVISKIIAKVKSSDPLTINRFAKSVCSNLSTNMSRAEMMLSAYKAIFSVNYQMKTLRIPAEGNYSFGMHGDQSTLDVDIEACRELLRSEIYGG